MRFAVIYRSRSVAPIEATPMLMGALGQWVETYTGRFPVMDFFMSGGGLVIGDFDDVAELQQVVASNPFTPYMDVEVQPLIAPAEAMATYEQAVAALAGAAQPG
jgi:hypothetical protein